MDRSSTVYQTYVKILKRELVCAMGCTEPIALAYCAAKARSVLGELPDRIIVEASGNIIKNVKSVVVPNTGGRCGIEAAAAIGALGGDENAQLQVIAGITDAVTEGKRARQLSLPRPCGLSSRSGKTGSRFGYIYSAWSASHASSCLWFSSMILFIPAASSASRNFGSMDSASTVPTLSAGPYFPISAMTAVISEDTALVSKV